MYSAISWEKKNFKRGGGGKGGGEKKNKGEKKVNALKIKAAPLNTRWQRSK